MGTRYLRRGFAAIAASANASLVTGPSRAFATTLPLRGRHGSEVNEVRSLWGCFPHGKYAEGKINEWSVIPATDWSV